MRWWAAALASIALCACASVALMERPEPPLSPDRFVWTCFAVFPRYAIPKVTPAAKVRPDAVALQCYIVDREAELVGIVTVWRMPPKQARPRA